MGSTVIKIKVSSLGTNDKGILSSGGGGGSVGSAPGGTLGISSNPSIERSTSNQTLINDDGSMIIKSDDEDYNMDEPISKQETDGISSIGSGHGMNGIKQQETLSTISSDPIGEIVEILRKDINERNKNDIDILINYFEDFTIMGEDVDKWSGQNTFRAFIKETKYRFVPYNNYVYKLGDDDDLCFYFILRGNVKLSKHEMVDTNSDDDIVTDLVIELNENHIFGENEMLKSDKRETNCLCSSTHGVHLAYWV